MLSDQEYVHQDKKVKVNSDSIQNEENIDFFKRNDFNDCHSSVQADNQLSPIFESILLNQKLNSTTESKTPSK